MTTTGTQGTKEGLLPMEEVERILKEIEAELTAINAREAMHLKHSQGLVYWYLHRSEMI